MAKTDLTAARLRELLDYNPETGHFTWRVDRRCGEYASVLVVKAGERAGCPTKDRRELISVEGARYKAHRLAWLYVYGEWPRHQIDHINGDSLDNRIANLRDVLQQRNLENRRTARPGSVSGFLGVSWHKVAKRWHARISIENRSRSLGYYDTPEEAHQAYLVGKRRLHEGCTI